MRYKYLDGYYILICTRSDTLSSTPLRRGHFSAAASKIARAHADRSAPFAATTIASFSVGVSNTLINSVFRSRFSFGGLPICFMDLLCPMKLFRSSKFCY